jgi:4-amino-4-deoxy-L-arabinose transferase-like glycosyltransferase
MVRRLWLLCLVVALLLRLVVVFMAARGPYDPYNPARMDGDTGKYLAYAISLSRGEGFSLHYQPVLPDFFAAPASVGPPGVPQPSFKKFIGYPLFIAASFVTFGYSLGVVLLLQALLSVITVPLVYETARQLAGARAGLLAMGLTAVYYPFALDAATLLPETMVTFSFALAVLAIVQFTKSVSVRKAMWAGIATAVAFLTKSVSLPLIPIALLWTLRRHQAWRATLAPGAVFLGVILVILAPVAVRNYGVLGRVSVQPSYSGSALIQLQNPYSGPGLYDPPGWVNFNFPGLRQAMREAAASVPPDRAGDEFAIDGAYTAYAVDFMRAEPMHALSNAWLSLVNTWMFDYPTAHIVRKASNVVCYVAMVPFFLVGSWMLVRRRDRAGLALLAWLAASLAVQAIFVSELRYRTGMLPQYFVVAALGLEMVWGRLVSRSKPLVS